MINCASVVYCHTIDFSSQEGSVFAGHRGPFEAWDTLPLLDDSIALKFIMPEEPLLG